MALGRFKFAADWVAGFVKTFGDNSAFIPAVTLVDSTGADASATLPTGAATSAKQDTQITAEQAILAKLSADPATQTTLAAILAKIIAAPATEATLAAQSAKLPAALGPAAGAASLSVVPSADQNPIFDNANGTKTSVTTSATIITPGAGHTFVRITTDVDIVVNTAGATAVDDGTASRIVANVPEVIPVTPSTAVKALSLAGAATVRCTPLKVR